MPRKAILFTVFFILVAAAGIYTWGISAGWYGELEDAGRIQAPAVPVEVLDARQAATAEVSPNDSLQILFGDLHVHTTFSSDAFRMSLPMVQGEGTHPPADACDFARVCSGLDFWALTDHAESLTRDKWLSSIESVRQCNAVSGDPRNPDLVTFMGFEWTQAGATPDTHYGHKNVIFRDTDPDRLPARPISSPFRAAFGSIPLNLQLLPPLRDLRNRQRYYDFGRLIQSIGEQPICPEGMHVRDLPADCAEIAPTPVELFRKLGEWDMASIVIPHGTTWGVYSPAGISLDKQLTAGMHDPRRQVLFEVYSGHGNSEEYRDWRAVTHDARGDMACPEPTPGYLPSCWRAGELIGERCRAAGLPATECKRRAAEARRQYLAYGQPGWHTVPGTRLEDWLDAGQCRDCFLPAFNYRPGGSAQYGLAISNFDDPAQPKRFRFGLVGSSDNHTARPGTGYKETGRRYSADWWGYRDAGSRKLYSTDRGEPEPRSVAVDVGEIDVFNILELERQASYFTTGGLVAVHADGRGRDTIWEALRSRRVYATSGPRILLWFDLLNGADGSQSMPMGSGASMRAAPRFRARALGAFRQLPGCPEYSYNAVSADRLERLCRGECYHPGSRRQAIERLEVVRIRPQARPGEAVGPLIEDPWRTFDCSAAGAQGCTVDFEDAEFAGAGRDAVYYLRAVQAPEPIINAGGLRCAYDDEGRCVRVNACYGDDRTDSEDDCLAEGRPRAWSSPIFVDYEGAPGADG